MIRVRRVLFWFISLFVASIGGLGCGESSDDSGGSGGSSGAGGASCGMDGGPSGWDCVGHVCYSPTSQSSVDLSLSFVHLRAQYGDPQNGAPFAGVVVGVCAQGTDCSAPLSSTTTDAEGVAKLTIPTSGPGFQGYFRASGPIVTQYISMFPPIAAEHAPLSKPWALFTAESLQSFATAISGATIDPTKAQVLTATTDCAGRFATGVSVTLDGSEPSAHSESDAAFFNVAAGEVELAGTLVLSGDLSSKIHIPVLAGAINVVHFGPTPLE